MRNIHNNKNLLLTVLTLAIALPTSLSAGDVKDAQPLKVLEENISLFPITVLIQQNVI